MTTLGDRSLGLWNISQGPLPVALFWEVETNITKQIIFCVAELSITATTAAQASWEVDVPKTWIFFSFLESFWTIFIEQCFSPPDAS